MQQGQHASTPTLILMGYPTLLMSHAASQAMVQQEHFAHTPFDGRACAGVHICNSSEWTSPTAVPPGLSQVLMEERKLQMLMGGM